jgi:NAD(P)-dependent dehydrogenase (short-subunit alcohol dehydrogenase family)
MAVVTGAGRGIGESLARALAARGARALAVCDIDTDAAQRVAADIAATQRCDARAYAMDVGDEDDVARVLGIVQRALGPIDLYCSNAGILMLDEPDWSVSSRPSSDWQRAFDVNVMAHVHACRIVLPPMRERGHGAFLITASAAGLLSQIGGAVYATTKHAAVGFAESLAITHGDDGIYAAVLRPQAVDTDMLSGVEQSTAAIDGVLAPADIAEHTLDAMAKGQFMIRPHPKVAGNVVAKAEDTDRWISGMRKLRARQLAKTGRPV